MPTPQKFQKIVNANGLHEVDMLKMPLRMQALKVFFMSGFVMSRLGSVLSIVRLLRRIGMFELLKPELRQFYPSVLNSVKRSFCRPKHWLTMFREMLNLDTSGYQLQPANQFDALPIVLITASSFF